MLGSALKFRSNPAGFFMEMSAQGEPLLNFKMLHINAFYVSSAEATQEMLVNKFRAFIKGGIFFDNGSKIFGNGLVFSNGEFWGRQRRIMQPMFHREALASYLSAMQAEAEVMLNAWREEAKQGPVDVHRHLNQLTLDIASKVLFGSSLSAEGRKNLLSSMAFMLHETQRRTLNGVDLPWWIPTPANRKLVSNIKTYDRITEEVIRDKENADPDDRSLVTLLLNTPDEETGEQMNYQQIIDEIKVFFIAGSDTSANALAWTLMLLAQHAEVLLKVQEEISAVVPEGGYPTMEQLNQLKYTEQVINESLRLYPPAWVISRSNPEPDSLAGFSIPAGSTQFQSPFALHRNPAYWEEPERFDPERFSPERGGAKSPAFIPFGNGARKCIGLRFAMMEMLTVLARVVPLVEFQLPAGHKVVPQFSATLEPQGGLPMQLKFRE